MTHAVVLGAGIAGLLAARVLADAFDEVTVVERDETVASGPRRGVPQGGHLHGLLDGGRQLLEELYPGVVDELAAAGAPSVEPLRDTRWYIHGRRLAGDTSGMRSVLATRPFLEAALRARALALRGVTLRHATATGLIEQGVDAVDGVVLRDGSLPADLVVDASGRSSRLPTWLARLGHPTPQEQRADVDLGYATRLYRRLPGTAFSGVTVSTVPRFRGGGCVAVEGDRWLVTLAGMLGDHPPTDPAGFAAWAATLPAPDIAAVIADAEPLDDPLPYRFRGSRWRRYDQMRLPTGIIALGDAVCSLNPLYAQGMTLAAQQVRILRTQLTGSTAVDPRAFHRATARVCAAAWGVATRSDLAMPEVDGRRPVWTRLLDDYVRRVQLAAHHDPVVARAFMRVANLTDPPSALLAPRLMVRAVAHGSR
ncbi:MAG: FAD-dependent monooxygenase [Pseudonocardia sp.]|nr:FAD-dependent monooxygenase [Pseudonocardia sp.]